MYESDRPIADKSQDRLSRYEFSAALAKTILSLSTADVFTIGLYGKWGSGKTSIINMALQEISTVSESLPDTDKPVIMQFNPWNYSDANQLIQQFFSCLSAALDVQIKGSKLPEIGETIKEYSDALGSATWIPVVGRYAKIVQLFGGLSGKTLARIKKSDTNITQIKEKISEALRKETRKIIIVIDDIDRLSNREIQMIFQLVNAVASFPNVVYLLSFDYNVVTRALKDVQNCEDGGEYLEKIIQVPFVIPTASKKYINQIFFDELNAIISQGNYGKEEFDKDHWDNIFWNVINPSIDSIRSVKRLLNTFQLKQGLMSSELNWIDLLAITSLQVFHCPICQWIQKNKDILIDSSYQYEGITGVTQKERKTTFLAEFEVIAPKQSQYMFDCVTTLFPQFAWSVGASYESYDSDLIRRTRRISSEENFDYFFNLSPADIPIRLETLNNIIYTADKPTVAAYIKFLIVNDKFLDFLTQLRGFETILSQERLVTLIPPLMLSLGRDKNESPSGVFLQSSDGLIKSIVAKFLFAVKTQETRMALWREAVQEMSADNLPGMAELIKREELAHGRLAGQTAKPDKQMLPLESLLKIESDYVKRITEIVKDTSLLDIHFLAPAYLWEYFDPIGYQQYIFAELGKSQINKCRFIAGCACEWKSLTSYIQVGWSYTPSNFEKYLTVEEAQKVIKECVRDGTFYSLPQETQEKLAAFILFLSPLVKEKDEISQKKAQLLLSMWKTNKPLETVDWDEIE